MLRVTRIVLARARRGVLRESVEVFWALESPPVLAWSHAGGERDDVSVAAAHTHATTKRCSELCSGEHCVADSTEIDTSPSSLIPHC